MSKTVWSMRVVQTPAGKLWLVAHEEKLWGAEFERRWAILQGRLERHDVSVLAGAALAPRRPILSDASSALREYFGGELAALRRIPLALEGSPLQRRVWSILARIPPGKTVSYKDLAELAGHAGAFRAIGAANGANPCAVFIPCHRVVSSTGELQGYGGGLEIKARLLSHEGVRNDGWRLLPKGQVEPRVA